MKFGGRRTRPDVHVSGLHLRIAHGSKEDIVSDAEARILIRCRGRLSSICQVRAVSEAVDFWKFTPAQMARRNPNR